MNKSKNQEQKDYRNKVINCIRKNGPISRTDICSDTGISKPTITRIVEEFIRDELVKQIGAMSATSKRKPVGLSLNPERYYCIGINVTKNRIRAVLADFTMNIVTINRSDIKELNRADFLLDTIDNSIRDLIEKSGIEKTKILGVGIGIPGIVDHNEGIVNDFAVEHKLKNIKLKEFLESKYEFSVFIDNDANTQALGEQWYGYANGYENSIFVNCIEGIGSGIISDGQLLRGKNNVTGELGHMIIDPHGRLCGCGKYGCLGTYSSTEAIENTVKTFVKNGRFSILSDKLQNIDDADYKMISQCAFDGDKLCMKCLRDAADMLSIGISNLTEILNPEIIILSGELFDVNLDFYELVVEYTKEKLFSSFSHDVKFFKREINDTIYELGAAVMVYKNFFKD
jgi:predicted NBD/HSP70 family sugar kinase